MQLRQTDFNLIRDKWQVKDNALDASEEVLRAERAEAIRDIADLVAHGESLRGKFQEIQNFVFEYAGVNKIAKLVYDKIGLILNR